MHNDGINPFTLPNSWKVFIWKLFFVYLFDVGVLCLHSSTIVLTRVQSDVLSEEDGVDLKLMMPIQ